jgi:hypothetical protein
MVPGRVPVYIYTDYVRYHVCTLFKPVALVLSNRFRLKGENPLCCLFFLRCGFGFRIKIQ